MTFTLGEEGSAPHECPEGNERDGEALRVDDQPSTPAAGNSRGHDRRLHLRPRKHPAERYVKLECLGSTTSYRIYRLISSRCTLQVVQDHRGTGMAHQRRFGEGLPGCGQRAGDNRDRRHDEDERMAPRNGPAARRDPPSVPAVIPSIGSN
jgi:hypothetical protein